MISLAGYIRDALGKDGGLVSGSMEHGCVECTHKKRYGSDLVREGVDFNQQRLENQVAGDDLNDNVSVNRTVSNCILTGSRMPFWKRMIIISRQVLTCPMLTKSSFQRGKPKDMLELLQWMGRP